MGGGSYALEILMGRGVLRLGNPDGRGVLRLGNPDGRGVLRLGNPDGKGIKEVWKSIVILVKRGPKVNRFNVGRSQYPLN